MQNAYDSGTHANLCKVSSSKEYNMLIKFMNNVCNNEKQSTLTTMFPKHNMNS